MVNDTQREVVFFFKHLETDGAGSYQRTCFGVQDYFLVVPDQFGCLVLFSRQHQGPPAANGACGVHEDIINPRYRHDMGHGTVNGG